MIKSDHQIFVLLSPLAINFSNVFQEITIDHEIATYDKIES